MSESRVNVWLAIGDRVVLWVIAITLLGAFIWHDVEAEQNSPTLIAPICIDAKAVKK